MNRRHLTLLALFLLLSPWAIATDDPESIWESIQDSTLDISLAVGVSAVNIDLGAGSLELHSGVLIPANKIAGRSTEVVFIGEAEFLMNPGDDLESDQLELFAGRREMNVAVQQAVLVIPREETIRSLIARDAVTLETETQSQAESVYADWVKGAVRRGFGSDSAQFRSLAGDRLYDGFFLAWCSTEELGDFYYALNPGEAEQVVLGQFVPVELDDREAHRLDKAIRRGQREGRYSRLRIDDLGDWDTWISTSLQDSSGAPLPGGAGFESEHYTLDVTVEPGEEKISGSATILVRAEWGGSRILSFAANDEIKFKAVKDADGNALPWIHADDGLLVILPEALEAGSTTEIGIEFGGKVLGELEKGIYVLLDTYSWYPRIGDFDRATYDVTLRWPQRHELLASGRVVDSGSEGKLRWERRELEIPTIAFSFEIGAFDIQTVTAGDVVITVAFSKTTGGSRKGAKQEVLEHLPKALTFFEEKFGDYPLDYMTVVTVPRGFSQGFLGFVTLTHALISNRILFVNETQVTELVAHELSHQWWGNKVGWVGYRDQWLSESLADFSSMLYAADQAERKSVYLSGQARAWRRTLNRKILDGRTLESLGPVVMGQRLGSSKSSGAYQAIVYQKGSVILNMLAQSLGTEPFSNMLKELANAVNNRVIDTRTFLKSIERMSGATLDAYSQRFVYGTGIPEVYYRYEFLEQDDGSWTIEGEARQVTSGRFDYTLEKTDRGTWNVVREHTESLDIEQSAIAAPFQVALAAKRDEKIEAEGLAGWETTTQKGLGGRLVLSGDVSEFVIPIKDRPTQFWFDQRGEVLANFFSEQREPKRMLRHRARELAAVGRFEEAEELYRKALAAPLYSESVENPPKQKEIDRRTRSQDALIHLGLARMYVDVGRDPDAATELAVVGSILKGFQKGFYKTNRMILRSRLAIRAGDYETVYREMEKLIYLRFPFRYDDTMGASSRRRKFSSRGRRRLNGLGYALFAVAAFETGHPEIARQSAKAATKRGAVMASLDELLR